MPKLEPKIIQKELEQGTLWPVYWIYGPEKLKSRELIKRIRRVVLGEESGNTPFYWNEEILDGNDVTMATILDSARSFSLGGGTKLILIREAHLLKHPELIIELCGPAQKKSALLSVCVFLAKDLDRRKKFSKTLQEKAAVVACDEVTEYQRESWIHYLAQGRQLNLPRDLVSRLCLLEPWSLEIIDQELEKLSLAELDQDVILGDPSLPVSLGGTDTFLENFFSRNLRLTLPFLVSIAERPEQSLPLLGLMGWNVRQLAILVADRKNATHHFNLRSYGSDRLQSWSRKWELKEVLKLQRQLSQMDFKLKQTPLLPLGVWNELVLEFCYT